MATKNVFRVGDVVVLRSDGPKMTIMSIDVLDSTLSQHTEATCSYFDKNMKHSESAFDIRQLKLLTHVEDDVAVEGQSLTPPPPSVPSVPPSPGSANDKTNPTTPTSGKNAPAATAKPASPKT